MTRPLISSLEAYDVHHFVDLRSSQIHFLLGKLGHRERLEAVKE
jgi:hypothetical protein